jgi:hypothetical protein
LPSSFQGSACAPSSFQVERLPLKRNQLLREAGCSNHASRPRGVARPALLVLLAAAALPTALAARVVLGILAGPLLPTSLAAALLAPRLLLLLCFSCFSPLGAKTCAMEPCTLRRFPCCGAFGNASYPCSSAICPLSIANKRARARWWAKG